MSVAMLNDVTRCIGCRSCQLACKEWNDLEATRTRNRGSYENPPRLSANTYTRMRFHEFEERGRLRWVFTKLGCMHCVDPGCVSVCTVGALQKTAAGPVVYDATRCIGCRYCEYACPFGVPKYDWDDPLGLIGKCTFCAGRLGAGMAPSCAKACPVDAIAFGERDELLAEAHRRIRDHRGRYFDHVYGETEAGSTNVLYIGPCDPAELGLPPLGPEPVTRYSEAVMRAAPLTIVAVAAALSGIAWYTHRRDDVRASEDAAPEETT